MVKEIKVRVVGENMTAWFDVDMDLEEEKWEEWTTNGANPHLEDIAFEEYYAEISIPARLVGPLNGEHFIFGWTEATWQSSKRPFPWNEVKRIEVVHE